MPVDPKIAAVRKRFYGYLKQGIPNKEAARLAEADDQNAAQAEAATLAPKKPATVTVVVEPVDGDGKTPTKREDIQIPDGWEELPWPDLRALAQSFSDDPIQSKKMAEAAIETEIERRHIASQQG